MLRIIYGIIGLILVVWIVATQIKCNKLTNDLNKAKIELLNQADTLDFINKQHLKTIELYESKISELNLEIDSLDNVKQRIIVKKDNVIVSDNISDAVTTLKTNLDLWKN